MIPRLLQTIFFLALILNSKSQSVDYSKVDSSAIYLGKSDSLSIPELTYKLTHTFSDPLLKTRAIFTWIAHNISYDCPAYHNESKRKGDPEEIFKLRKGVCEGYANLFQAMCSYANIQCLTIDGYARNGADILEENSDEPNHTWNAVRINGDWHLLDVTWASGYTDNKVRIFTQNFSDVYFFPNPEIFILNHYPKLDSWRLCKLTFSKKQFFQNPIICEDYLNGKVTSFEPKSKNLTEKIDSPFNFSMTLNNINLVNEVTVIIGEGTKAVRFDPLFEKQGNKILFSAKYNKTGSFPLTIIVNHMPYLIYQLEIN
jgi:hypothetical protein